MTTEESLYIKILLWAYDRSVDGFNEQDLISHFGLKDGNEDLYKWYLRVFKHGTNDNPPMIDSFVLRNDGIHYSCLTEKGMSAAIDYLELKESLRSSKEAKEIALWSIWIAVVVGLFQILIQY